VCGAYEGGLTTDCPGTRSDFDKQREVYETSLDYTDDRGWHQGERMAQRSPHFKATRLPPKPPEVDPRTIVASMVDWTKVDRNEALQHELTLKAIAWVLADRSCDDLSAVLARAKDEADSHEDAEPGLLLDKLEDARVNFQRGCQHVEARDEEFRQAARKLVDALEGPPDPPTVALDPQATRSPANGTPPLLDEIQGPILAEHLPRTIDRIESAIARLLETMPEFKGGGTLIEKLGEEMACLRFAAREACREAKVPWTSKFEEERWRRWTQNLIKQGSAGPKDR
jgi:exonuclease VII small subunit